MGQAMESISITKEQADELAAAITRDFSDYFDYLLPKIADLISMPDSDINLDQVIKATNNAVNAALPRAAEHGYSYAAATIIRATVNTQDQRLIKTLPDAITAALIRAVEPGSCYAAAAIIRATVNTQDQRLIKTLPDAITAALIRAAETENDVIAISIIRATAETQNEKLIQALPPAITAALNAAHAAGKSDAVTRIRSTLGMPAIVSEAVKNWKPLLAYPSALTLLERLAEDRAR